MIHPIETVDSTPEPARHLPGLRPLAAVGLGAAAGAVARWGLMEIDIAGTSSGWPWTLWWVNVLGAAVLGLLTALPALAARPLLALGLGPGLLGGFTSVSAASEDVRALLADGRAGLALAWWASMLLASLLAVHGGRFLARRLSSPLAPPPTPPTGPTPQVRP